MTHNYASIQDLTDDSCARIWGGADTMHFAHLGRTWPLTLVCAPSSASNRYALQAKWKVSQKRGTAAWVAAHHFGPR